MRFNMRSGAGSSGGIGSAVYLHPNDSRRVACPACGAPKIRRCVKRDGTYAKNSHEARRLAFRISQVEGGS